MTRRRRPVNRGAAAAVAISACLAACGGGSKHALVSPSSAAAPTATTTTAPPVSVPPEGVSIVAQATGSKVGIYTDADAPSPASELSNPQPSGAPLVFLVQEFKGSWLHALLPVRPNGSTGWIRSDQVSLSQHQFRIVVELGAHHITVYNGTDIVDQEPVGVGTQLTPTPGGLYYTKELLQPPNPNGPYGPYAYGLSGFSNVLTTFDGGDGVIGIHGTNDPSAIGHDVSHGCIRMSNAGITKLAHLLPLGVPVEIRP